MSDLANQTPASTYKGLLQVGDYTDGVDSTVKAVLDGEGTASALAIGTTKVGVGTTSPSQELDVSGNVVADEYALDQTGSSSSAVAIHAPATNELALRTNSTEAMRIDSDGKVGIGTTTPDSYLTVSKPHTDSSDGVDNLITLSTAEAPSQDLVAGDGVGVLFKIPCATGQGQVGARVAAVRENGTDLDSSTEMIFEVSQNDETLDEAMRIDSSGNVGIGTASPNTELSVVGTVTASREVKYVLELSTEDPTDYDMNANDGVGIQFKLPNHSSSSFVGAGIAAMKGDPADESSATDLTFLISQDNETLDEAMRIDSNGNVGIGTVSPSAPLEVTSTTGGVIMPRMTTTQMNAISSPTDGEMIYNTTENKFYGRANGAWTALH